MTTMKTSIPSPNEGEAQPMYMYTKLRFGHTHTLSLSPGRRFSNRTFTLLAEKPTAFDGAGCLIWPALSSRIIKGEGTRKCGRLATIDCNSFTKRQAHSRISIFLFFEASYNWKNLHHEKKFVPMQQNNGERGNNRVRRIILSVLRYCRTTTHLQNVAWLKITRICFKQLQYESRESEFM